MALLGLSFLAGVLTVLAPCVFPLLPVLIGGSVKEGEKSHPWIIMASFAVSVILFTFAIKLLVDQFGIFPDDLTKISARILIVFGIVFLFPKLWQYFMHVTGLEGVTAKAQASEKSGIGGEIALGFILGPIFNSCSPTYAVLVANVLPVNFAWGFVNILAYVGGLVLILSLVAYGGRAVIKKMKWAVNPNGWFRRIVAIILIVVGVSILMKRDKQVETWFIQNNLIIDTTQREIEQTQKYRKR